ncbi:thiamine-phosphate kinase [Iodobacter fluviatilis]|uniref:Thiamine-monophosphate kinase n=1 Tax=Iodobacter fluviatilis TaxID=537 RepID=A0A377Q9R9_9NEIS|nr:thiamine-phosphate kinase [Iodobacter fluviatilis]TCU88610.1 thiamine-monophosphate kinase [Iodobacter fluviatilis]STQ91319.1 Thiamine-monophosphate kinase [Iodobacter fluviatilis]
MNEFDLIAHYFKRPAKNADLGIGDDAALVSVAAGHQLAISADMLVEGRHFFSDADPERLGRKVLAVNLSDLAAMGAKPSWFTLSLALPKMDEPWLEAFSRGLFAMAGEHDISLIGGDTTCGPLTIAIQIAGSLPRGQALLRSGARAGDEVWVSGPLGGAAAAVMHRTGRVKLPSDVAERCDLRLDVPVPRIELGLRLRGIASAALDISDGLLADLRHICEQSACGAEVRLDAVPFVEDLHALPEHLRQEAFLAGGDDYELCFTAAPDQHKAIIALADELELGLTLVGKIIQGNTVHLLDASRQPLPIIFHGFDHFAYES